MFQKIILMCFALTICTAANGMEPSESSVEASLEVAHVFYGKNQRTNDPQEKEEFLNVALGIYFELAWQGNADAQNKLGLIYDEKSSAAGDFKDKQELFNEAERWFLKAAAQGHVSAQCHLNNIYGEESYKTNDPQEKKDFLDKSEKWYRRASELGYAVAQCNLGVICAKKSSYAVDPQEKEDLFNEAQQWYTKAAEQGLERARANLDALEGQKKMCTQHSEAINRRSKQLRLRRAALPADFKAQKSLDKPDEQKVLEKRCVVCDAEALKICERCRKVRYCSRACQASNWSEHKPHCNKYSEANDLEEQEFLKQGDASILLAVQREDEAAIAAASGDEVNSLVMVNDIIKLKPPLICAIHLRKRASLEALLKHPDIQVEATDAHGKTALWYAVNQNDEDLVKVLLSYGANACALEASVLEACGDGIKAILKDALVEQLDEVRGQVITSIFLKTANFSDNQLVNLFINLLKKRAAVLATSLFEIIVSEHADAVLLLKHRLSEVCSSLCKAAAAREPLQTLKGRCPNEYDLLTALDLQSASLLFMFVSPENLIFPAIAINNIE